MTTHIQERQSQNGDQWAKVKQFCLDIGLPWELSFKVGPSLFGQTPPFSTLIRNKGLSFTNPLSWMEVGNGSLCAIKEAPTVNQSSPRLGPCPGQISFTLVH